ncbi:MULTISPECIES: DUF1254 domain-containing protein [Niastella]|uniref:DUF1254 domain-containing protein n=1 Tax=Niastella soli TaxID=2821487 RepID=A0ABS3YRY6_9BACT|nr:DUF1254 domain-containing protein [Niastella soli]MBO9200548.1 DUF1254 domain-containing protein [Niastella soli]
MGQTTRRSTSKKLIKEEDTSTLVLDYANYQFKGGYPTEATIQRAYDESDLYRAVQAYKFFYPTVSGAAIFIGNKKIGIELNKTFGILDSKPKHVGFTLNSDTPYGPIEINLTNGPMVIDIPAGPLIVVALDINQRWVADMGIPGPDGDKGGKFLLLPPGYAEEIPAGYHIIRNTTNQILVGVRSVPVGGDVPAAMERIKTVKVYPLHKTSNWEEPTFPDLTPQPQDTTPLAWENNIEFWKVLHDVIDKEPVVESYRNYYGDLAVLGIAKGRPFEPDEHMKAILVKAAKIANAQMRVQAFADRRPDRIVWPDRKWEWVGLRFEDGDFNTTNYVDLDAREKWFYQAIGASPAMFHRGAGSGSLYWLGVRDNKGNWLMGDNTYKLTVPTPVPGKLFWSVTVYDNQTRSQVITDQGKAALRSLFELKGKDTGNSLDLYFGPTAPTGKEGEWIQTIPGKGWFAYIRVYGPEKDVFDGSWKPGDFEMIK